MTDRTAIRAVAFDMDGLMFNTEDLYDQVGEILLNRRGQSFDRELKLAMMGRPGPVAFEIMRNRLQLTDSIEQLQLESTEIFDQILPTQIATLPGLESLLDWLDARQIPKCVATSSHRPFANLALGQFDLQRRFAFLLTSEDVERGKPDPEIYLKAASRFQVDPREMLVLEDSVTGSTAARAAGALTIAIPTCHSRGQDFSHVDYLVDRLDSPLIRDMIQGTGSGN